MGVFFLFFHQTSFAQDCIGPLSINLSGSSTADSIQVVLLSNDITCASDVNGSLTVLVNGGNPYYDFAWDDISDTDSVRTNLAEGIYLGTVTDQVGCTKEISWEVQQLDATNSDLVMNDGCGNCLLTNGSSSYFFDGFNNYIAALSDSGSDSEALGDTEVCVEIDDNINTCQNNPYLQRHWSVAPSNNESACLKLFFTQSEFESLAGALPSETSSVNDLVANQRICVTAFSGGNESCDDFDTQTVFSTAAAPPLVLTHEDPVKGIWSVEVCTDKFATYYVNVCDYALPVDLLYFTGRRSENGNLLEWETASEINASHFEIERSRDGQYFNFLDELAADGTTNLVNTYSYLDADPSVSRDYYRLKMVDLDGSYAYSNIVIIDQEAQEAARVYPSIFTDYVYYETTFKGDDKLEMLVYDISGKVAHQQHFNVSRGAQKLAINLERLPAGTYFLQVSSRNTAETKGFKLVSYK